MKVQANGITLGYDDHGRGTPLVFLHAFPFNRTMWEPQVTVLSARHRVITIDLRGHGESDAPFWRYSLEQYADDVRVLLAHLGIAKAVFVGLSMGGYLAFTLYRRYPESILGLVLADTRAEADTAAQSKWRFDLAQRAGALGPSAVVEDMLPKLLSPRRYARDPDLVERVRAIQASAPVPGIVGDLMAMAERPDSTDMLASISVPTLVLCGEDDVLTTPTDAERIARGIRGAKLTTIPDAGHMSNMEQPALFNRAIEEFVRGIPL
ncbi:MAG TPA: alpha/beta fold hydrolase [Nitrospira sp.]|nr:alpha/beta fold hydrolase [Nitrospira sp.]